MTSGTDHHFQGTCDRTTFTHHGQEVTSTYYPLRDGLRLFGATVAPTILYAAATWTMTVSTKTELNTTPRRTVRMITMKGTQSGNVVRSFEEGSKLKITDPLRWGISAGNKVALVISRRFGLVAEIWSPKFDLENYPSARVVEVIRSGP